MPTERDRYASTLSSCDKTPESRGGSSDSASYRIPITVAADKLSFSVKHFRSLERVLPTGSKFAPGVSPTGNEVGKGRIELLSNVNAVAYPGELLAVMGPSGCGKTTLLNVITGRANGKVSGSVLFNGMDVPCRKLKGCVTMLHANDKMLPYLTVEETLHFQALLKMAHSTSEKRKQHVTRVMDELALTHVRDTRIGGAWKKGLSSGELRRTSIAQELIGNPSVLILDEPTSGLDAVLAYEVVFVLRRLAAAGRTVICTLHQPRSSIFNLVDKVMLMANGRVLYHGKPAAACHFFKVSIGRDVDPTQNIGDALIDIASDVPAKEEGLEKDKGDCKIENTRQPGLSHQAATAYSSSVEFQCLLAEIDLEKSRPHSLQQPRHRNVIVQWCLEAWAVAFRSFFNSLRNPLGFGLAIIIQLCMGCLIGAIFFRLPYKYLPDSKPPNIGSTDSSNLVKTDFAMFLTTGIDGKGTNPFIDSLVNGTDGMGSRPIDQLSSGSAVSRLVGFVPCTHNRMGLQNHPEYESTDYSAYQALWAGSDDETTQGGSWNTPHIAATLIQTLQIADATLYQSPWYEYWKFCRSATTSNINLSCYGCIGGANVFVGAATECVGLPPLPTMGALCRIDIKDPDEYQYPPGWTAPRPPGWETPGKATKALPAKTRSSMIDLDLDGVADPASVRHLQASGMISGGGGGILAFLPEHVLKLGTTAQEYEAAIRKCEHPVCKKIVKNWDTVAPSVAGGFGDYAKVFGAVMNIAGALFFIVTEIGFASYDGLIGLVNERPMFNREVANRTYHTSSYFVGKSVADLLFQMVPCCFLYISFFALVGIEYGPHGRYFFNYIGICISTVFASYGFAYAISAISPSAEAASVTAPLLLVIFICCSGFFVRDSAIPRWMIWLKWLSLYRWGFFALCVNQFPPGFFYWGIPNTFNLAVIGISVTSVNQCIAALIALGFFYRVIAYLALRFMNKQVGVES